MTDAPVQNENLWTYLWYGIGIVVATLSGAVSKLFLMREASNKKLVETLEAKVDKFEKLLDDTKNSLADTNAGLAVARAHIEDCDKDREELRGRITVLENK